MTLLPGPTKAECQGDRERCTRKDCPAFGTLGRPARDGLRRVRGCGDPVARGARNRRKGLAKQRVARRRLGVRPSHKFGDADEERWGDALFANEVKSGRQCDPVKNAWARAESQIRASEPDHGGQHKPARVTWMPEGWGSDGLVAVRLSAWEQIVSPALEAFYGQAA